MFCPKCNRDSEQTPQRRCPACGGMLLSVADDDRGPEKFDESRLKALLESAKKDLDAAFEDDVALQLDEQEMRELDPGGQPLPADVGLGPDIEEEVLRAFELEREPEAENGDTRNEFALEASGQAASRGRKSRRRAAVWMLTGIAAVATAFVLLWEKAPLNTTARDGSRLFDAAPPLRSGSSEPLPAPPGPAAPLSRTDAADTGHADQPEQSAAESDGPAPSGAAALPDEALTPPAPAGSTVETPAPGGAAADTRYAVHTDSFRSRTMAEKELERLQRLGYTGYLDQAAIPDRGIWFRVMVGPFSSRDEARDILGQLKSLAGKQHPAVMELPREP